MLKQQQQQQHMLSNKPQMILAGAVAFCLAVLHASPLCGFALYTPRTATLVSSSTLRKSNRVDNPMLFGVVRRRQSLWLGFNLQPHNTESPGFIVPSS